MSLHNLLPSTTGLFSSRTSCIQEVKFRFQQKKPTEKVRASIADEAKNWDIPVNPRDIHITKRGPSFSVEIDYPLIVDLRVHQFTWPQHVLTAGPLFEDDRH
jgi:hypothetical protein